MQPTGETMSGSELWKVDVPPDWSDSIRRIRYERRKKILVIGESGSGKSTYCKQLIGQLCSAGFRVAFVDGDIGQADLGPSAAISLGYLQGNGLLSDAKAGNLYFVGDVTPIGNFLPIIVGMRKLTDSANADFIVINTTGFIANSGVLLNWFQIESLQPDLIVALERTGELDPILRVYEAMNSIRIHPSRLAHKKPASIRKKVREEAFRIYFHDAEEVMLKMDHLVLQGRGTIIPDVFRERPRLCGVSDRNHQCLGLALLSELNREEGTVSLLTPVFPQAIRTLQFGNLWVTKDGRHGRMKTEEEVRGS